MPSAYGFIKGVAGGNKFTSTFVIDDIMYQFSGNLSPAVQEFQSDEATLEYSSLDALTTVEDFNGKVGTHSINFSINNGTRINGPLNLPMQPASRVAGSGTWVQT